jgi:putative endonuclease
MKDTDTATVRMRRGAAAETRGALHLQACGLRLIGRNLRCKAGELDLVCLDGDILVIVEVRLRSRQDFGGASASVTPGKRRKLIRAAAYFCTRNPDWRHRRIRFDVVAIDGAALEWIRDAFRAG